MDKVKKEPIDIKKSASQLLGKISKYKVGIIFVLLFAVIKAVMQVVSMFLLGNATDFVIDSISGGLVVAGLIKIVVALGASYLVTIIFDYMQQILIIGITNKFVYNLRGEVENKLKRLPLAYYDNTATGDMLSIVTNDVDTLANSIQRSIPNFISSILTLIITFVGMMLINVKLTLIGIIIIPISILSSLAIMKFSQKYFRQRQDTLAEVGGYIEENFTGHEIIKAFNHEDVACEEFEEINKSLYKSSKVSQFASSVAFPISTFFSNLTYVVIVVLGGIQVLNNPASLSIGNLQTIIQLLRQFTQPIAQLSNMLTDIQYALAAGNRIFAYLETDEEIADPDFPEIIEEPKGAVDFVDVEFGYQPDKMIINDLNLRVESGDRVAIVGPTGAGKTTLVNLLMRFYDINSGQILVDNIDIKNVKRDDLRSLFGMVLQDTWLFKGSVLENIRYGKLDATDQEVIKAAESAYVNEFILMHPEGYDMIIEEDASNISSGQRQLITIARALLSDPKILILDEATSAVDTRTEVLIQKAMEALMKDRTSFVIAHRLSTIRDSKTILVMQDGDIVESGNHEELISKKGFYYKLYNSQMLGEEDE